MVKSISSKCPLKVGVVFSFVKKVLILTFFSGNKVRCNICGHNFRRFAAGGASRKRNARCPACGSMEWGRVLWFYLSNEVLGKKNKNKFLYFLSDRAIKEKLEKINIELDISTSAYFENIVADDSAKLPGGKYDVIIFAQLLQAVKDEQAVFAELKRLLRTGGFVVIITLINWEMDRTYEKPVTDEDKDRLKHFYSPGLERVYGSDIDKRLVKAGFDVETIDYADQLGNAAREYYRLGEGHGEIIFKCKKT